MCYCKLVSWKILIDLADLKESLFLEKPKAMWFKRKEFCVTHKVYCHSWSIY